MNKLSVIIPVYNGEEYLRKCLDSVVNQSIGIDNIEVIIVNDNSTDNSLNIINEYCDKYPSFKLISNNSQLGAGESRNKAIGEVRSDYLTFIDCDDFISLNAYEDSLLKIEESGADLIVFNWETYTGTDYVEPINIHQQNTLENKLINSIDENPKLIFSTPSWNKIYHKSLFKYLKFSNALYDDNLAVVSSLINASKIFLSKDATYFYRKNLTSTTENITPQHGIDLSESIKELYDLNNRNVALLNVKFINDVLFWIYYYDWSIPDEIAVISKLRESAYNISAKDLDYFKQLFPDYEVFYRKDCLDLNNFDSETFLAKYKYFNRLNKINSTASLYIDKGNGFNEDSKISVDYIPQKNNKLSFDLTKFSNIVSIRFDPLEGSFIKSKINNIAVTDANCDNSINDDYQIFLNLDPNYIFSADLNGELIIDFDLEFINDDELASLFVEKNAIIAEKNNIINEINHKDKKGRFNFFK
ncbi:glycosyltransferase family 2 protein [uncultured Methanobrevibacter sp.]|uniref:glycosyltransferase family 2 protein n=1 Tax=uncultured Methanobrevibacter sp. TaxID=253161 RepID=UPI0025DD189D|nr:glycosyltransferase family 2 protein [uncultured Methanobrevibacter sp.]